MSRSTRINIAPLLSSNKSGPHLVTISNVTKYKNNLGERLKSMGKEGVIVTFKNDEIEHMERYVIGGYGYSKFLKLIDMVKTSTHYSPKSPEPFVRSEEMTGKKLWIVIRHNITVIGDKEVKRESELVEYSPEDKKPNVPALIEEYDIATV